jgi:glycine/D-amino acid oxidase-like deaminating enzyme
MSIDVVVIGAGLVGAAIGYGLASRGARILVIDGDDHDFRAAQANGALVWLQGKGLGMPAYHQLTSASVDLWPDFARSLFDATAIDVQYERNGGLWPCLGEAEFEQRRETMLRWRNQLGGAEPDSEMLDREAAQKLFPKAEFGPEVTGASFGRRDGYCNPIRLLPALQAGCGAAFPCGRSVETLVAASRWSSGPSVCRPSAW